MINHLVWAENVWLSASSVGINYKHQSVNFNDYDLQLLLPQKQSTIDNALTVADL